MCGELTGPFVTRRGGTLHSLAYIVRGRQRWMGRRNCGALPHMPQSAAVRQLDRPGRRDPRTCV